MIITLKVERAILDTLRFRYASQTKLIKSLTSTNHIQIEINHGLFLFIVLNILYVLSLTEITLWFWV